MTTTNKNQTLIVTLHTCATTGAVAAIGGLSDTPITMGPDSLNQFIAALLKINYDLKHKQAREARDAQQETRTYPYGCGAPSFVEVPNLRAQEGGYQFLSSTLESIPGMPPVIMIHNMPDANDWAMGVTADRCNAIGTVLTTMADDARSLASMLPSGSQKAEADYSI